MEKTSYEGVSHTKDSNRSITAFQRKTQPMYKGSKDVDPKTNQLIHLKKRVKTIKQAGHRIFMSKIKQRKIFRRDRLSASIIMANCSKCIIC